jgi:hypothetical protein
MELSLAVCEMLTGAGQVARGDWWEGRACGGNDQEPRGRGPGSGL